MVMDVDVLDLSMIFINAIAPLLSPLIMPGIEYSRSTLSSQLCVEVMVFKLNHLS